MSYTPTVWRTGDKVTSAKLNKLEQGVANAGSDIEIEVDSTLTQQGKPADAKAVGDALANIDIDVDVDTTLTQQGVPADAKSVGDAMNAKLAKPTTDGTSGQVLMTNGQGGVTWGTVQGGGSSVDIDDTLTQQGEAADSKAVGDALALKMTKPNTDGTNGQVLTTDGNGGVSWGSVAVDDTVIANSVNDWIEDHPEAVGTVADGSITRAKLDADVGAAIDNVSNTRRDVDTISLLSEEAIPFTIIEGSYIKHADGGETPYANYNCTDYIDVSKYKSVSFKQLNVTATTTTTGMAFYDENRTYISGLPSIPAQPEYSYADGLCVKQIPQNAKYARFSVWADTATYGDFEIYGEQIIVDSVHDIDNNLNNYLLNKITWVYPNNWLNRAALSDGVLNPNGTVSSTSGKSYTDYIPVTPGDKVRFIRTDTHGTPYRRGLACYDENKNLMPSAGSPSTTTSAFTVPNGVYYVRLSSDTNIMANYDVVIAINPPEDINTVKFSDYFEPYQVFTEDFLRPESKEVVQKLVDSELNSYRLKNQYACGLPHGRSLRMTVGIPETWYASAAFNLNSTYGDVGAGSEYSSKTDNGFYFPNTTALNSVNGFSWKYYDPFLAVIDSENGSAGFGQPRKIIAENLSDCTMLVIGDSKTEQGQITATLLSHFTEQGHTITLLGTVQYGDDTLNRHEGRAGWSTTDYYNPSKAGRVNPFYNPDTQTFDFSYYMTNQGYSSPDFVTIELGVNDLYNGSQSDIVPTYNRLKGMIDSVRAFDSNIKILLVLPTQPNIKQSEMIVFRPNYVTRVIKYNSYVLERTLKEYSMNNVRPTYCHLVVNPETDVRDNVHPTNAGYQKMGLEICNQINCWQNGV